MKFCILNILFLLVFIIKFFKIFKSYMFKGEDEVEIFRGLVYVESGIGKYRKFELDI